ncbi:MAG: MFS transporter [Solirubrobacterales bacterium]
MRRYADILRSPHVGALVSSALLARLPIGINALAIVLYLREQTGSFAVAGVVAGTLAAGSGVGAPVQGRLVDRIGARRVLLPLAILHAAMLGAIVGLAELGAPAFVLVLCGFTAGFAVPPTSSVLRSMWTDLLEPRLHQAAYALDSTMIELIFISGPLLTALIAALTSPAGALIVSAVAVITGTAIFTALEPTRHVEPEHERTKGLLGALASPGVRTLVCISMPTGVGLGMLEVGIPAFTRAEGAAPLAGVLLAIWSIGSGVGGLLYGTLPRRGGLYRTHLFVAALMPFTLLPLALAPSVWVMALLVIPAGSASRRCWPRATSWSAASPRPACARRPTPGRSPRSWAGSRSARRSAA